MSHIYYDKTGLEIVPDGPFFADLLYDYLENTTYRWECNQYRTHFLIEDFEYSEEELLQKLGDELHDFNIQVEFNLSD